MRDVTGSVRERLIALTEPVLGRLGYELVDLEYGTGPGRAVVRLRRPAEGTVRPTSHPGAAMGAIYSPEPLNRAFGPDGFLRRFDLRGELGQITAPTLVMAGRHDWICPPEFSREIAGLIPGSRLIEIENSSHSVRVDAPDVLLRELAAFIGAA